MGPASASIPSPVAVTLAFTRLEDVVADASGSGLPRARTLDAGAAMDPRSYDRRVCQAWDCSTTPGLRPELREHGFAHADVSRVKGLQDACERVRVAGRIDDSDAAQIRRCLLGRALTLSGGARLRLLHIAREGFFMRRAGPNGMRLVDARNPGMNDHDAAMAVHADQDVEGTPLRQILRGLAPRLFHHESPARSNLRSRLFLVNVWIPLDQATRPLALMDRRTLDRRKHQLRHGLPTSAFLRRREDMRVNDIWTFLHDEAQRWYFTSEIDAGTAYVFETLSTPHGAFILPGEDRAEARYRRLTAAVDAVQRRDEPSALRALRPHEPDDAHGEPVTAPLRRAIAAMDAALAEGFDKSAALCRGEDPSRWCARASEAANRVVRKSLEMRAVALFTPGG
jgi:hypothetical protein